MCDNWIWLACVVISPAMQQGLVSLKVFESCNIHLVKRGSIVVPLAVSIHWRGEYRRSGDQTMESKQADGSTTIVQANR